MDGTMDEAYWQGFIEKCAELGIDPEELLKQAQLGTALKGAVTSGAKGAWGVILRAIRKLGATTAGKAVGQFGRGVAAPYKAFGRAAAGKGISMGPMPGAAEAAGRVVGLGAGPAVGVGLGLSGLLRLLDEGKAPEPPKSPMAGVSSQLKDWYEQLRGKVS